MRLNSSSGHGDRSHWKSNGSVGPSKSSRAGDGGKACGGSTGAAASVYGTPVSSSVRSQPSSHHIIGWIAVSRPNVQRPRLRIGRPHKWTM